MTSIDSIVLQNQVHEHIKKDFIYTGMFWRMYHSAWNRMSYILKLWYIGFPPIPVKMKIRTFMEIFSNVTWI